ncbi:unnamed protein product, partial [Phaeothamnion confervicola]
MITSGSGLPKGIALDHVSPATRLLEKRRQMFEVQEALEAQKEEFARREEAFHRRQDALRQKDLELQESLIKFNKFLQENESKRNRAVKRAADERKQREQKEAEIQKLRKQYAEKVDEETGLKNDLGRLRRYHDYLTQVAEAAAEDYPEVQDLLNRFRTLKDANRDLTAAQTSDEAAAERLREEFAAYSKERANDALNENNEVATLRKRLDGGGRAVFVLQSELDAKTRAASDRMLEMGQVLGAVANILERCEQGSSIKRGGGGGGGGSGSCAAAAAGAGADRRRRPKTLEDTEAEGKLAIERLEEICNYMCDFAELVNEHVDVQRAAKR